MPAINCKNAREFKILLPVNGLSCRFLKFFRRTFPVSLFLVVIFLLSFSFACAPPPPSPDSENREQSSASGDIPEITDETIKQRINGVRIRKVPEENGTAEPISWMFDEDEPMEIAVVEKKVEGASAVIVLDIKTQSAPRAREPRQLAGQIRTVWALQTGWVLRKWEIINSENISMKYKNLPKPPAQNSDR